MLFVITVNHAWDSWTVNGATDANCDLWSLYVNQNVSNQF